MAAANGILVGSGHIAERLRLAVDDPRDQRQGPARPAGRRHRRCSPPVPEPGEAAERLSAGARRGRRASDPDPPERVGSRPPGRRGRCRVVRGAPGPRVIFVGKLIVSKGVDLLLAAWPLVHARQPGRAPADRRVRRAAERRCERSWAGSPRGDLDAAARAGGPRPRRSRAGRRRRCRCSSAFLDHLPAGYADGARAAAGSVSLRRPPRARRGRRAWSPRRDALVFPSTFPEAFGMVAAEAAAAGVLPVSAAPLGRCRGQPRAGRRAARPARATWSRSSSTMARSRRSPSGSTRWLALDRGRPRAAARAALRETVERLWSWEGVARGVLAASARATSTGCRVRSAA